MIHITAMVEHFPIRGAFVISRERRTVQTVIRIMIEAEIDDKLFTGQGECVPYKRYYESVESVLAQIVAVKDEFADSIEHLAALLAQMPAGAARNGLDCALWDLKAKFYAKPVWQLLNLPQPKPCTTCFTISLGTADEMAEAAKNAAQKYPILKLKLGGDGDAQRMMAVRKAAPNAIIVADANEGWAPEQFDELMQAAFDAKLALIEQPLPASNDEMLRTAKRLVPVCADESLHVSSDLQHLIGKYDAVNIKLDKAGGLTEALKIVEMAKAHKFQIMIGCMLATSLAMAPAMLLTANADFVDLDGPLLLEQDRAGGLRFDGAQILPPQANLWG